MSNNIYTTYLQKHAKLINSQITKVSTILVARGLNPDDAQTIVYAEAISAIQDIYFGLGGRMAEKEIDKEFEQAFDRYCTFRAKNLTPQSMQVADAQLKRAGINNKGMELTDVQKHYNNVTNRGNYTTKFNAEEWIKYEASAEMGYNN